MRQSTKAQSRLRRGGPRPRRGFLAASSAAVLAGVLVFALPAAALPPMANPDSATTPEDTAVEVHVLANDTDPEGNTLLITDWTQGANGTVTDGTPFDDALRYTPAPSFTGQDTFTYTIDDDLVAPGGTSTATVTVNVKPVLNIGDATIEEGSANATFEVTISSADPVAPVTVNFATADGTALAGTDYQLTAASVTFPANDATPKPISVPLVGDTLDELDETFVVNLSTPTGAFVVDGQGAGTITDDDPLAALSVSDATVAEGDASSTPVSFNVTLNTPSTKPISLGYVTGNGSASAPGDFEATSAQVFFNPGETQKPATVKVVGDTTFEENESFTVTLILPVNAEIADGTAVGTIQNNDALLGMACDITGTPRADRLTGTAASERICGMGGNDTISGGGGDDEIFGDVGNDTINGDDGGDAIEGGRGNDKLLGGAGGDSLEGGGGRDVLNGGAGDDTIDGEAGNDVAHGDEDADVLDGGPGNDTLFGDAGNDRLEGLAGNDRLSGDAGNDFVDGSSGNDRVAGGPGNDQVLGLSGSDRVTGGSGNDLISGGGGVDHVTFGSRVTVDLSKARASGEGRDRVLLVEIVTGSGAADTLIGNSARNVLNGRGGRDRLMGRGGGDVLNGGGGNDTLFGQAGRDLLLGSAGNDKCEVGPGGGRRQSC